MALHTTAVAEVVERTPAALEKQNSRAAVLPTVLPVEKSSHFARLAALLTSFPSRVFWVSAGGYFLLTCLYLLFTFTLQRPTAPIPHSLAEWGISLTTAWRHWDAYFFLHVAQFGYTDQGLAAFFPLYPALVRFVAWPLGQHYTLAALVVSWACSWGAYQELYRLAEREYGERKAKLALLFLACCPLSVFCFAPYSESIFLLVSIGAVERARAGRPWQAGLLGALGMLSRPTGILLLIPLGWECARRSGWLKVSGWRVKFALSSSAFSSSWLSLALIPAALAGYMLYLRLITGNALAFLKGESLWQRHFTLPWNTVGLFAIAFQRAGQAHAPELYAINILDLLLVLPLPALVLYCATRRRALWLGAAFYQLALTLMLVSVPTYPATLPYEVLLSTQRFMLPAFPLFLLLGQLGEKRSRLTWFLLAISLLILIFNTLRFLDGNFIA